MTKRIKFAPRADVGISPVRSYTAKKKMENVVLHQKSFTDEKLWQGTVDHVIVHADERVMFHFKDGKKIVTRL